MDMAKDDWLSVIQGMICNLTAKMTDLRQIFGLYSYTTFFGYTLHKNPTLILHMAHQKVDPTNRNFQQIILFAFLNRNLQLCMGCIVQVGIKLIFLLYTYFSIHIDGLHLFTFIWPNSSFVFFPFFLVYKCWGMVARALQT